MAPATLHINRYWLSMCELHEPGAISSSGVINLSVNPMNWITEKGHGDVVCFQREEKVPGTGLRPAKI